MEFIKLSLLLLTIPGCIYGEVIQKQIEPNGKVNLLAPGDGAEGVIETQWILNTQKDFRIQVNCSMQVYNCLKASLTIDTGKDVTSYCGNKAHGHIFRTSTKNTIEVSLLTNNAPNSVHCEAVTVRSFLSIDEAKPYSAEAGVTQGRKQTTCSCGTAKKAAARIVGGNETKINEFSFPVVIVRSDKKIAFCGGSILTEYHVLTAAHCTYTMAASVPLTVGVGEHDLTTVKETSVTQFVQVQKVIRHEKFDGESKLYDISILVLKDKIKFNSLVGPVCLPNKRTPFSDQVVRVMGWGKIFDGGFQSDVLMKADLRVVDFYQCSEYYRKLRLTNPHQFCTYGKGRDTCTGDSGGPVLWVDPETNRYVQVGVVSYGNGCAFPEMPAVNTDVSCFLDWIQDTIKKTKPAQTCTKID